MRVSCDDSSDFSKYFPAADKSSLYNYSQSHHNETLLLETTDLHGQKDHPKQGSLLEDLYEQLQVTIQQSRSASGDGADLGEMCRQLLGSLKKLQLKVERMEEQDRTRQQKESRSSDNQREVESVLSFSSKGSKCRCEERVMGNLLEYVEQRSKVDVYRQQKQALQRQVVRLEVSNEDLRKQVRKLEGENMKVKELLKQYQQLNRKQNRQEYQDPTPEDNYRPTHSRTPTLDQISAAEYLNLQRQAEKENFKQMFQRKIRQQQQRGYCHSPPMTPNPLLRTVKQHFQTTSTKSPVLDRRLQLNSRFEQLMDLDNQKTESKSREGRLMPLKAFPRSPRQYRQDMLEQEDYQIGGKNILEQVDTMTSLPDSSPPSFFELKRIQSSRSLLCAPQPLSPLRSLQKGRR